MDLGISVAIQQINQYQAQMGLITRTTNRAMGQVSGAISRVQGSWNKLVAQVPALGTAMTALRNPIVGVAIALGTIVSQGSAAVKVTKDFQKQVADTAAIIGIQKTDAAYTALIDKARQLGRDTEFSATQSAEAMEFLARAGFSAEQSIASAESTLALATVGNLNLAKAADLASNVLSQFGLVTEDVEQQAANLGRVVDVISKTTTSSNTNVVQYANAMNYLGATAKAMSIPIEEASAVIGIMANSGLQGTLATRALGTSLVNLSKPTAKAAKEIARIGLDAFNTEGNFVGLAALIGQLEQAYTGFTQEQTQASLATIFGAESIQEMNILLSAGSNEIAKYTTEIQAAGAQQGAFAQQIRDTKLDNYDGALRILRSSYQDLQIEIGGRVTPALTNFVRGLTEAIRSVTGFIQTSSGLSAIGRIFAGLRTVFAPVGEAVRNVLSAIYDLVSGIMGDLFGALQSTGSLFSSIASGAAQALALAINAIAVGINAMAAIVRGVIAILRQFEGLLTAVAGALAANIIVTKALTIAQTVGRVASLAFAATQALLAGNVTRASAAMKLLGLSTRATAAIMAVANTATKVMGTVMAVATGKIKLVTIAQKALNIVFKANPIGIIITLIGAAIAAFVRWYQSSDTARAKFAGAFAYIKTIFANFVGGFILQAAGIREIFGGIFTLDFDRVKAGMKALGEGIRRQTIDIAKGAGEAYRKAYNAKLQEGVEETSKVAAQAPINAAAQTEKAIGVITEAANASEKAFNSIKSQIANLSSDSDFSVINSLRNKIDQDLNQGVLNPDQANRLRKSLEVQIKKPIDEATKAAAGSINALESKLQDLQKRLDSISPNPDAFASIGKDISDLEQRIADAKLQQIEIQASLNFDQEALNNAAQELQSQTVELQASIDPGSIEGDLAGIIANISQTNAEITVQENGVDAIRKRVEGLSEVLASLSSREVEIKAEVSGTTNIQAQAQLIQSQIERLNQTRIQIQSSNIPILTERVEALQAVIDTLEIGDKFEAFSQQLRNANIELAQAQLFRLDSQVQSIEVLQEKLQIVQGLSKKLGPDDPQFANVLKEIEQVEIAIQRIENKKILIEAGINLDPSVLSIQSLSVPDLEITAKLNVESNVPEFIQPINALQESARALGFSFDFVNQNFRSTSDLMAVVNSDAFNLASALGASSDQAAQFALGLEQLKTQVVDTLINGVARSFEAFGKELGTALANGTSATAAFQTLFKGLLNVILSEVPKLIGTFLIQAGVGLGFPAGLPFILAGIGLVAFSGIASGLLSKIGGSQANQEIAGTSNASRAALEGASGGSAARGFGLSGVSAERDNQPTIVRNTIVIEWDGIRDIVKEEEIISNENRFGG